MKNLQQWEEGTLEFQTEPGRECGRNGWNRAGARGGEWKVQWDEVIKQTAQLPPAFVYLSLLLFALFIRIINSRGQASSGVTAVYFSQHKLSSWLQCSSGVLL